MFKKFFYCIQILVVSFSSLLGAVDVFASSLQQDDSLPKKINIKYTQIKVQQNGLELPSNTEINSKNQNIDVLYDWQIPDGQQIKANDYFMLNGIPKSFQAASALGLNVDLLDAKKQVIASAQYKDHANKIKFIFKKDLAANDLKGHITMNFKATYNEKGWSYFKINQKDYRLFDERYQKRQMESKPVNQVNQTNQTNLNDQYLPIKKNGRYDYDPNTKRLTYTWRIFLNHAKLYNNEFIIRDTLPEYLNLDVESININYGYLKLKKDDDQQVYLNDFNRLGIVSPRDVYVQSVNGREFIIKGNSLLGNQYDYEISYTTSIDVNHANFKYLRQGNNIAVQNVVQLEDSYKNILGEDVANLSFVASGQGIGEYIEQGDLKIIKQDQINQKLLSGAVFNLYDQDKNLIKKNLKTDQNGYVLVPNLKVGKYILTEIKAPNGYQIDKKELILQIEEGQTKTIIFKNKPQPMVTKVKGTVKWFDKRDVKAHRPQQVELNLVQNGKVLKTVTVTAKNKWNYKFENLPEFDEAGQRYQYTVNEVNIPKYNSKQDGFDFINVLTGITSIQGQKIWQDKNNEARLRPNKIEIELMQNKKVIQKVQIGAADQWQYKFDYLEQYNARGHEYKYDVAEVPVKNYVTKKDGYDFINVFQPSYTQVRGHKIWIDNNNAEKTRPNQIAVKLFKNGQIINKKAVTAFRQWSYEFNQLEKYDAEGNLNHYQIKEDSVDGYKTDINGFNLQNTLMDGQTQIQGMKIWQDDNNYEKIRPNQIVLELTQAKKVVKTQIITEKNNWQYVFKTLPKYQNGVKLNYQVREQPVEGYQTQYKDNDIVNTLVGTTQIKGKISWKDRNDQSGLRPQKITIKLFQNGIEYQDIQIRDKDGWGYMFNDLPKYDQLGKLYKYTVSKISIPGYDSKQQGNDFTNQMKLILSKAKLAVLPKTKFESVEAMEDKNPTPEASAEEKIEPSKMNEPATITEAPQVHVAPKVTEEFKEQEAKLAFLPETKFESVETIEDKNPTPEVNAEEKIEPSKMKEPATITETPKVHVAPKVTEEPKEEEATLAFLLETKFESVETMEDKNYTPEVNAEEKVEPLKMKEPATITEAPQVHVAPEVTEEPKEEEAKLAVLPETKFETAETMEDNNPTPEASAEEKTEPSKMKEPATITEAPQVRVAPKAIEEPKEQEAKLAFLPETKFESVETIEDKNSTPVVNAEEKTEPSKMKEPATITEAPQVRVAPKVTEEPKEQEAKLAFLPETKFESVETIEDKNSTPVVNAEEKTEPSKMKEPATITEVPQVHEAKVEKPKEQEATLAVLPETKFESVETMEDKNYTPKVNAEEKVEPLKMREPAIITEAPQVHEAKVTEKPKEEEANLAVLPETKFETAEIMEDNNPTPEASAEEKIEPSKMKEPATITEARQVHVAPKVTEDPKEEEATLAVLPETKFETAETMEDKNPTPEASAEEKTEPSKMKEPTTITESPQVHVAPKVTEEPKEEEATLAVLPETKFESVETMEDKNYTPEVNAEEKVEPLKMREPAIITEAPQVHEAKVTEEPKEQEAKLAFLPETKFETVETMEDKNSTPVVNAEEKTEPSKMKEPATITEARQVHVAPKVTEDPKEEEATLAVLPETKFETAETMEDKNPTPEVSVEEKVEPSKMNDQAGKPKLPNTHIYGDSIYLVKILVELILINLLSLYWYFRKDKLI